MANPYVMSVLLVCGLLLVGVVLRAAVRPLRAMFVPASVVGGLIGLALIQAGLRAGPAEVARDDGDVILLDDQIWTGYDSAGKVSDYFREEELHLSDATAGGMLNAPPQGTAGGRAQYWSAELSNTLDGWPGLLIAVVFAGLLIERPGKRFGEAIVRAGRQGIVVWIIVLGQVFLGLLATALLIAPFYDVPPIFGQLIETGFAGGHGTAAAMGEVFAGANYNFPAGRDLAFVFATVGLLWGTLSGIVLINIGVRRGWARRIPTPSGRGWLRSEAEQPGEGGSAEGPARSPSPGPSGHPLPEGEGAQKTSHAAAAGPAPVAFARIRPEIIDPLAFQLCILAAAFGVGYAMQQAFLFGADLLADARTMSFVGNVPLFLFTLLGGWTTREAMHLAGLGRFIDPPSINRLTGIAMEILIVAALATLRIDAAAEYLWPMLLLLGVGCAWCVFCLVWLSRRLLPKDYWFELGLINYGMSTATTAQGMLLLRIVDPELDSGAAEDYAAAAPLSAPFIGGGVLTVLGIPLALGALGYWPVIVACGLVIAGLYVLGRMLGRADDEKGRERRGFEVVR